MDESMISPLAKRLADENSIDWRGIKGSGEGGRVIEKDILVYLSGIVRGEVALPSTRDVSEPPPSYGTVNLAEAGLKLAREGVDLSSVIAYPVLPPEASQTALAGSATREYGNPALPDPNSSAILDMSDMNLVERGQAPIHWDGLTGSERSGERAPTGDDAAFEFSFESPEETPDIPAMGDPVAVIAAPPVEPAEPEPATGVADGDWGWLSDLTPVRAEDLAPTGAPPALEAPRLVPDQELTLPSGLEALAPRDLEAPTELTSERPALTVHEFEPPVTPPAPSFELADHDTRRDEPEVAAPSSEPAGFAPAGAPGFAAETFADNDLDNDLMDTFDFELDDDDLSGAMGDTLETPPAQQVAAPDTSQPDTGSATEGAGPATGTEADAQAAQPEPRTEPQAVQPQPTEPLAAPQTSEPQAAPLPVSFEEPTAPGAAEATSPVVTAPVVVSPVEPAWQPFAARPVPTFAARPAPSLPTQTVITLRRHFDATNLLDAQLKLTEPLDELGVPLAVFLGRAASRAVALLGKRSIALATVGDEGLTILATPRLQASFRDALQDYQRATDADENPDVTVIDATELGVDELELPVPGILLCLGQLRDGLDDAVSATLTLQGYFGARSGAAYLNRVVEQLESPITLMV